VLSYRSNTGSCP